MKNVAHYVYVAMYTSLAMWSNHTVLHRATTHCVMQTALRRLQ